MTASEPKNYHVCDHPRLLVKDGICYLCEEFDGQIDLLGELE